MKSKKKQKQLITAALWVAVIIIIIKILKKTGMISDYPYKAGAAFLEKFEGFRANAYPDYKQHSIGFGTKAKSPNEVITRTEAMARLNAHVQPLVNKLKGFGFTGSQQVGFVSFGYNLGSASLDLMLKRLREGQTLEQVTTSMKKYINAGGKPLTILAKRRQAEVDLILKKTVL